MFDLGQLTDALMHPGALSRTKPKRMEASDGRNGVEERFNLIAFSNALRNPCYVFNQASQSSILQYFRSMRRRHATVLYVTETTLFLKNRNDAWLDLSPLPILSSSCSLGSL
jgi:hypothetical protein